MKLIIDIDEDYYKAICKRAERFGRGSAILPPSERIIFNGTSLSEELEKIRAKINSKDIDCLYEEDFAYSYGLHEAIQIIDDRISELKGENK